MPRSRHVCGARKADGRLLQPISVGHYRQRKHLGPIEKLHIEVYKTLSLILNEAHQILPILRFSSNSRRFAIAQPILAPIALSLQALELILSMAATAIVLPPVTPPDYHRIISPSLKVPNDPQTSIPVGLLACQRTSSTSSIEAVELNTKRQATRYSGN